MLSFSGLLAQANSPVALPLATGVAHCVVTSPPYWGHRDYRGAGGEVFEPMQFLASEHGPRMVIPEWRGDYGQEPDPYWYVGHTVALMREVRRILRPDGVVWLNLGDTLLDGSKANIPGRVWLALMADGWTVRMDHIWNKPNPMPDPADGWRWERHRIKVEKAVPDWRKFAHDKDGLVEGFVASRAGGNYGLRHKPKWRDCEGCEQCEPNGGYVLKRGSWRHTVAHEVILQCTQGMQYWADAEIVAERSSEETRNPRSVATIATANYPGQHTATFPPDLIRPLILSSTPRRACPACGTGWAPVVERAKHPTRDMEAQRAADAELTGRTDGHISGPSGQTDETYVSGYRPACEHKRRKPVSGLVVDPFCGSGTTGQVAREAGLAFVGFDLSMQYLSEQARVRVLKGTPPSALDDLPLFGGST